MKDSLTQALSETCLEASQNKINAAVDRAGNTSLHLAALRGEAALIEGLLQQAPELAMSVNQQGQSVLHLAAQQQQPEALQRLLSLMQAEQIALCLTRHDAHGKQPLFYALYHNHPLMTKALLEQGANVNDIVDISHQSTALHVAAFWGHIDILQLLLEHGASIAELNETRHTPIEVGLIQHPRWALACLRLHYQLDSTLLGLHLSQNWLKVWQEAEADCANGNLAEASTGFDMLRQYAEQQALLPLQIYCIGTEASLRLEQAASLAALAHQYNEFTSFLAKKAWRKAALMYEEAAKFYNAALGYTIYHAKALDEFNDNPLPATYADSLWASLQAVSSCMAQELFKRQLPTLSPILGYRQATAAIPKVMAFELEESSSLRGCLAFATSQVKVLLTRMLREAEQVLGKPPCGYAAIGLGSMSRDEISPCSDIEWALLLEKDTPAHRHYFRQLTQWVHLSLIHLGQTPLPLQRYSTPQLMLTIRCNDALSPTPQGLRLDDALISPLGHSEVECELMGEPQNLAQWVMERLLQCEELPARLPMFHTLQSSVFIHGEPHLAKTYSQAIHHYIQQRLKSGRQQKEALGLLKVHTEEDYPLALQQVANHGNLSVKSGLYRPVTMIVNDLVMYYGLCEQNTWDRIAALQRLGHISQAAAKHLTQALEGSMRFRLITHLHYGTEYEALWHPSMDITEVATAPLTVYNPPLVLSASQITMLGTIYQILLPFYQDIACFINTQGRTKALRIANWASLNPVEAKLANALSASYANDLNQAIAQLQEALALKADNPTIYLQLLLCLQQRYPSDNTLEVKETLTKLIHLLCHQQADAYRHLTYYSALPDSLRHYYRMEIAAKAASQNAMSRRLTKLLWDLNCHPDRGGGRERVKELQQNWRQAVQGIIGNTDSGVYLWTAMGKRQPLCQAAIEQLLVNGQFKENRINGGQHNVVELRCGDSHLFVKENPELAGMSFLIERLHEEFIGHGTTRSELAMLQVQERFMPVLLSLPVTGPSLQQVLLDTPQLLATFNHRAFSERVFMALMTNPEDGLPTNEIVEALPSGDHVLTSIDHDHAMFPAFALETDGQTQASKLQLKVKTILYCLPQMHATVDPLARDAFVKLDIRQRLRAVLQAAQLQNSAYEVLNRQAGTQLKLTLFSRPSVKKNIPVPIKPGDASLLFHKALRLQRFLRMYPEATLLQCLLHIEPRVGILYAQAFIDEPQPIDRLRKLGNYPVNPQGIMVSRTQAIETIRLASNQITPKLYAPEELRPQEGMAELDTLAAQQADLATIRAEVQQGEFSRFKAIRVPEHRNSIINGDSEWQLAGIDWSPLNNKQQLSLLQALVEPVTGYPHGVPLYRLNLAGCRVLAIQHFEQLLRTCPDLSWLDISGHAGMTESQVRLLAKACKTLQVLVIKNLPRLRQLTKCAFPQLRQLVIDGCPVTEVTIDAPHLQIFSAKNCTALTHLALPMSSQLKTVKLRGCEQITMQALKERYPCFISQPGLTQQWLVKVSKTLEKAFPANIPLAMQQEVVYQAMVSYQQYLQPIHQLAASQLDNGTAELLAHLGLADNRVIEFLLECLSFCRTEDRIAAINALGQLGQADSLVVKALLRELLNKDLMVRYAAVEALSQLGQAESLIITVLVQALDNEDYPARKAAVEALGRLSKAEPLAITALVRALGDEYSPVRQAAAEALGQLSKVEPLAIMALVRALGDADYPVRYAAAMVLVQLGQAEPLVITALVRALGDADYHDREAVAKLLAQLGQAEPLVIKALVRALGDEYCPVRQATAEALGQLGQAEPLVIKELVRALGDEYSPVRQAAAKLLGELGQAEPLVITALVRALGDEYSPVRQAAAEALGQLGQSEPLMIKALVRALGDKYSPVRQAAAKLLGELGQAEPLVITALVRALGDEYSPVRQAAAEALGELGQAEPLVIKALVRALGDEYSPVRQAAAEALGELGQAEPLVIKALVRALGDEYSPVRQAAAKLLGELGQAEPLVIKALVRALGDEYSPVRQAAAEALGELGQAEPLVIIALVQAPLDNDLIFELAAEILGQLTQSNSFIIKALLQVLYDKYKNVCQTAAKALGQLSQAEPFFITALVQALGDEDLVVRHAAAKVLGQLGQAGPLVIAPIMQALGDEDYPTRQAAAKVLGQLGQAEPLVIKALVRALGDEYYHVRQAAAKALGQLGQAEPLVVKALVQALGDRYGNVRQTAAKALGQLSQADPLVIKVLVQALNDKYQNVRQAAAELLSQLSQADPLVIKVLVQALNDKYQNVRQAAAEVLGQLNQAEPLVIKGLAQALLDEDYHVRQAAAKALGQLGQAHPFIITALLQALDDKYKNVRQAAARALARLSQESSDLLQELGKADLRVINLLISALRENRGQVRLALNKLLRTLLQPDVAFNLLIAQSLPQLTPMHSFHTVTTKEKTENSAVASIAALQPPTVSVDNDGLIRQSKNESIASLYFKEMESELTTLHSLALPESLGGTHEIIRFLQHNLRHDAVINPFEWDMHPDTGELSLENQTFPYATFNSEFLQSAEKKAFVLPLLLMRAHFAGLVIYKTQDKFKVIYINPTGTNPPQKGEDKEALAKIGQALQKLKDKHQLVFEEIKILSNNQQLNESDCAFIVAQSLVEMATGQALSIKKYDDDLTCYVKPIAHARAYFYSRACLGDNYEATIRDQWYARLAKAFTMNIAYVNELTHFIENERVNPYQLDERILGQLKVLVRQINDNTIAKQQGTLLVDKATSFLTTSLILKTIDIKEIKLFCEQLLEPHFTEEGSLIFKLHPQLQKCSQKSGKDFNGTSSTQQTHPAYGSLFASEPGNIRQISELHAKAEEQNQSEEAAKPSI